MCRSVTSCLQGETTAALLPPLEANVANTEKMQSELVATRGSIET